MVLSQLSFKQNKLRQVAGIEEVILYVETFLLKILYNLNMLHIYIVFRNKNKKIDMRVNIIKIMIKILNYFQTINLIRQDTT